MITMILKEEILSQLAKENEKKVKTSFILVDLLEKIKI